MLTKKVVSVIYKKQAYQITLDDINSFQSLKTILSEGFNIDRKEYNMKINLSGTESKDYYEEEEFLMWKNNLKKDSIITIEILKYDELLNDINLEKSLRLEQFSYRKSQEFDSSSLSICSVTSSKILQMNKEKREIDEHQTSVRNIENKEIYSKEKSDGSPEKNFHFVLKEEIEEIMDQINAKLDIKSQLCEICRIPPISAKYYCIFCEDMLLCEKCEKYHLHPLIKYNNSSVKNKTQMSNLISKVNEVEAYPSITKNLRNSFIIQKLNSVFLNKQTSIAEIILPTTEILLPPNNEKVVHVRISNLSIDTYISKEMILFPINYKDLEIDVSPLNNDIAPQKYIDIDVRIKSRDKLSEYDLKFTLYNGGEEMSCICPNNLHIRVGFDESLTYDDFFIDYKNILILTTPQKKMIYDLIINEVSKKTPTEIYDILIKNKWNLEESLDELLSEKTN